MCCAPRSLTLFAAGVRVRLVLVAWAISFFAYSPSSFAQGPSSPATAAASSGTTRSTVDTQSLAAGISSASEESVASSGSSTAAQLLLALLPEGELHGGSVPLRVGGANVYQFKSLIVPELFSLVRDGQLEMSAFRRVPFALADDEQWLSLSQGRKNALGKEKSISPQLDRWQRGFLFGSADDLLRQDEEALGLEIMLNASARQFAWAAVRSSFSLALFRSERLERSLEGILVRVHPRGEGGASAQIFREFVQMTAPPPVVDYRFLTFRFLGSEEDPLWMYSPSLKQVRQLTGSNRSDPLFRTSASLDDFGLWSAKPELFDAQFDRLLTALVPVAGFEAPLLADAVGSEPCREVVFDAAPVPGDLVESESFSVSGGNSARISLPEGTIFIPRDLLRITLNPRDPFGLTGRVIVYLDRQLQIPLAKVVFDRSGQLWKIVLGALTVASSQDGSRREPLLRSITIADQLAQSQTVIQNLTISLCDELPVHLARDYFDPAKLAPPAPTPIESQPRSAEGVASTGVH